MSWPLVLAGPVLRRVDLAYKTEPSSAPVQLVSVWVALREASTVTLSLWSGRKNVGATGGVAPTDGAIASASAHTIRIGEQLHLAQVTWKSSASPGLLQSGLLYSYNIAVTAALSGEADLRSLGLLADATGPVPNKALGYGEGFLPSFCTLPPALEDLRMVHGSCRKMQGGGRDCMEAVDQIIAANPDSVNRPHQLFLTGDQIYADDVSLRFLPELTRAGSRLLFGDSHGGDLSQPATTLEQLPVQGKSYPCDQANFPTGRRQWLCDHEALFSTTDGLAHLFGFGEFCAMYLCMFANAIWPAWPPTDDAVAAARTAITDDAINPMLVAGPALTQEQLDDVTNTFDSEDATLKTLWNALPNCRRALANVPSYMILDDHEVTDDFYLSGLWRRRVLGAPLGRAILRNAQVAYGLFQGWGNDPVAFESDAAASFLTQAQALFPTVASGPAPAAVTAIELLLGMNDPQTLPRVEWSYVVDGPKHRVIVLDGRTHRGYDGLYTSPRILDYQALLDQIPGDPPPAGEPNPFAGNGDPLPAGLQVAVVVAPAPVLGISVMEDLVEPAYTRFFDMIHITQRGEDGGLFENDAEAWAFNANGFEAFLRRLAKLKRVVFLSGDLHFGFTTSMAYYQKSDDGKSLPQVAVYAQLVSSAVKNVSGHPPFHSWMLNTSMFQWILGTALFPVSKVGYLNHTPSPITLPVGGTAPIKARMPLEKDPAILSTAGWPDGTTSAVPDWGWRMDGLVLDQRSDAQRPTAAAPDPLPADVQTDNRADTLTAYAAVAARHQSAMRKNAPRRVVWGSNIGLVSFLVSGDAVSVQHELYSFHEPLDAAADSVPADSQAEPFTVHVVSLEPAAVDQDHPTPVIGTMKTS